MAEADLSVGPPGVPDKFGGGAAALEAELVDDELQDDALDLATIKGLVLGAAGVLHQSLAAQYPERPDVAVMEDGEAEKIAQALSVDVQATPWATYGAREGRRGDACDRLARLHRARNRRHRRGPAREEKTWRHGRKWNSFSS